MIKYLKIGSIYQYIYPGGALGKYWRTFETYHEISPTIDFADKTRYNGKQVFIKNAFILIKDNKPLSRLERIINENS